MWLNRRQVLRGVGLATLGGLAGCAGNGAGGPKTVHQDAKIVPEDGESEDRFGVSIDASDDGSTVVIGSRNADEGAENTGAAYVYVHEDKSWVQQATLTATDANRQDSFAFSVSLSDDGSTALVGARWDDGANGPSRGSAYVFERESGSWTQRTKLTAENGLPKDRFGWSVALSGDGSTALVGAPGNNHPDVENPGSAHVFERSPEGWSERAELAPTDSDFAPGFGRAVALATDGGDALVTANGHVEFVETPDSAFVFGRTDEEWVQRSRLFPEDNRPEDQFGDTAAFAGDGSTALVGAPGKGSGAAYVFETDGTNWSQRTELTASDGQERTFFGTSLALDDEGARALVGANGDGTSEEDDRGVAYVFDRESDSWSQASKLLADDGEGRDSFGTSVAVAADGSTVFVGATGDSDSASSAGSAYVFDVS